MAQKSPEQLAQEFEGRKAKGLAKGAAAYWPNVMANAVLKLVAGGQEPGVATLLALLEKDAMATDHALKAGSAEAAARLKQAVAKAAP